MTTDRAGDKRIEALAAGLPADTAARRATLEAAANAYHAAIMGGDEPSRQAAEQRARAALVALNGGKLFGFAETGKAPDRMLDDCAAKPGTVPSWGQRGEFIVTVDAIRVRVMFSPNLGSSMPAHMGLYAVDPAMPFLSDTGFRSCWQSDLIAGQTVDEAARIIIEQSLAQSGRVMIAQRSRQHREAEPVPAWINAETGPAAAFYEDKSGQVAFAF